MRLRNRRIIKVSVLFIVIALYSLFCYLKQIRIQDISLLTGCVLLAVFLFLMLMNLIRKLPFYSLANARFWSQAHIYIGFFGLAAYLWHTHGFHIPNGWLEATLAMLFYLTAVSGILGLVIFRRFPKHLTRRGEEVIYERIPMYRIKIQQQAEMIVNQSVGEQGSDAIANFYLGRLKRFFLRPRNFTAHILGFQRGSYQLLLEIQGMGRYFDEKEQEYLNELTELIRKKDDLDYHYALQSVLKYWLFVHIPLAYGLLIFAIIHIVIASSFTGP